MAPSQITKTELVWPGKSQNEDGTLTQLPRVNLPLQVAEVFNQTRLKRDTEWRNKLIWGDNLLVMGSLLEKFAGKVDLIYMDPCLPPVQISPSLRRLANNKLPGNRLRTKQHIGTHGRSVWAPI